MQIYGSAAHERITQLWPFLEARYYSIEGVLSFSLDIDHGMHQDLGILKFTIIHSIPARSI